MVQNQKNQDIFNKSMPRITSKQSRRLGLNLSGRAKDGYVKRPYAPGILDSQRKHRTNQSEYGLQLKEKQKMRFAYGVSEKQFSNYVANLKLLSSKLKLSPQEVLINQLESRLDNIVYKIGLSSSRAGARQIVSHAQITVNGKSLNIASAKITIGDVVAVKESKKSKKVFTQIAERLKEYKAPKFLELDTEKMVAKVISMPTESEYAFDTQKVLEYYSR
jgi:small subunit ribosomal protein S4